VNKKASRHRGIEASSREENREWTRIGMEENKKKRKTSADYADGKRLFKRIFKRKKRKRRCELMG